MKKFFVFIMAFSFGFGLFGCNNSVNKEKGNIDEINIEDNDVKNIIYMVSESHEDKITMIMENKIRSVLKGASTFYLCKIDNKKYDILCAYIDESLYQSERFRNYDYYLKAKWYKYTENDVIKESINNLKLTGIFKVYDVEIKYDIIYDKIYNRNCKYYSKIDEKMDESKNILLDYDSELKYNDLIIWEEFEIINNDNYFITNRIFDLSYEVRMDLSEKKQVTFDKVTAVSNGATQELIKLQFGEFYEYFYEYFKNEKDYKKIIFSPSYYELHEKVSIDLEQFIKIIKEIKE